MSKKKKVFNGIVVCILILGVIWYVVPRSGTFDSLILNRFSNKDIVSISINDSKSKKDDYVSIDNKDKINEFVNDLNKLQLVQYRGQVPNDGLDYSIELTCVGTSYDNAIISNYLRITMVNKHYITIKTSVDSKMKEGTYLVDKGGFNLKYIDELLEK